MNSCFLSCDWGSTSFRIYMVDSKSGAVLANASSSKGIAWANSAFLQTGEASGKRAAFFSSIIQQHIEEMKSSGAQLPSNAPVLLSGMASSNIGMVQLPYARLPFSCNGEALLTHTVRMGDGTSRDIVIISGVRTEDDVMRGEETQLLGAVADGVTDGLFLFPGTHSKHITVAAGKAVHFDTFMTGELFQLLATHSMLSGSIAVNEDLDDALHKSAFASGVAKAKELPLLHSLFTTRTNQLLKDMAATANYHYLSGLLIGAELAGINGEQQRITIAAAPGLLKRYQLALSILVPDAGIISLEAVRATIRGHQMLYKKLYG